MPLSVGQYEELLKSFKKNGAKALEPYLSGSKESNSNLVDALKKAYQNTTTALTRPGQEGQKDTEDNRDLFNALCDEAGKRNLYKKIDKKEMSEAKESFRKQLDIYHKFRGDTILGEHQALLDMGFHFGDFKDSKTPGTTKTEREEELKAGGDLTGILTSQEGKSVVQTLSKTFEAKNPEKKESSTKTTYDKRGTPETSF